jgi:hypothetical protein
MVADAFEINGVDAILLTMQLFKTIVQKILNFFK